MGKRGPQPKVIDTTWTPGLAYVVGIFASDGNLGKDGMYLDVTSKDREILKTVLRVLDMNHIKIGEKYSGDGNRAYRVQFKRVLFHKWLMSIGLTPNKSKTLGPVDIPNKYFFDFVRGVWDGDGTIYSFWDPRWRSSYMYYIAFASASPVFLEWMRKRINKLSKVGIGGKISQGSSVLQLRYAKKEAFILFKYMFKCKNTPYLKRKFTKAQKIFTIDEQNAKKWHYNKI
ncbi:hypothetical protein ACFL0K_02670 [Patescibacteria group bacterium]